ncbi:MAG: SAM-dependent DNA methyltransferase [Rhodoferax sp.]|nr:SAM-dependent DNA methyltransferase [Rhodoferax sp.]
MMQSLDKDLRSALEKTVKAARAVAETAANAAVDQLGVGQDKPEAFLSDSEKALRNRLRTHGKQLGDARDSKSTNPTYGKQEVQHLMQEVAYEHWHRMLFARFLADNNLLMYDGVAVTIEECDELAPDEGAKSGWELAGKLAARMLPQVFKPGSPVFELTFAPEHQSELEQLLKALPEAVFKASDSLGWVYQFWQADNKERINKSEVKIGADELPAVTQLFTEPYMVAFLLQNSLGAWWSTRHPGKPCPVNLDYFRTLEDGMPAAGEFEDWPDSLSKFKLLDPCCGSGHFLVAAFLMLVPMRMAAEDLSANEAVNLVLAENIHGLEIDPRCVEIAVFAVALEAWRYPDKASGKPLGVREIPTPNIACCGLKVAANAQDWEALVPDDSPRASSLRNGLRSLHETFAQAPLLGSLLDPRGSNKGDLFSEDYDNLQELLIKALANESSSLNSNETWEVALAAQGLLEAARLLDQRYSLVITNVPYLGISKQHQVIVNYCSNRWPLAKYDLALAFVERIRALLEPKGGIASLVTFGEWLYLGLYAPYRKQFLQTSSPKIVVRLGWGAFSTPIRANPALFTFSSQESKSKFSFLDASNRNGFEENISAIHTGEMIVLSKDMVESNPDARFVYLRQATGRPLGDYVEARSGLHAGDLHQFFKCFWESFNLKPDWELVQTAVNSTAKFSGRDQMILWEQESGRLAALAESVRHLNHAAQNWRAGKPFWGKQGVIVGLMGKAQCSLYSGDPFDVNSSAFIPRNQEILPALWSFCESGDFSRAVRELDTSLKLAPKTLLKVTFDLNYWKEIAADQYPQGLPKPYSDDPTQWIFHGHPCGSVLWNEEKKTVGHGQLRIEHNVLHIAVARLVGYTWPTENDNQIELAVEAREWVDRCSALAAHADIDGIVCIPPVGRESSASDRLLNLLVAAYGEAWSNDILTQLLAAADHAGKSLETWLRDKFFTQHCTLFGSRPFVWHVWDGLRDGFSAMVNYHKLNYKTLEALIYTYLGDWISRQKRDADSRVDGAQEKLAAAEALKKRLELILSGEAPYDIFVRWKPTEEQPIGWNPDLNDGVRVNIRPFLSVPDVGKRGAGVLREKPKSLHWEKDRGSDIQSAPWYQLGLMYDGKVGDRINDHHLSLDDKRKAREKAK